MQIKHILGEKGSEVIGILGDATLSDAVNLMVRKRIGAVVVHGSSGNLAGILSERDVVRAVAEESAAALARPVSAYMTRAVATCTETDSVDDLMEMMTNGRFRHVPVLDGENRLMGIISIGDVVKSRIAETVREVVTLREYISASG